MFDFCQKEWITLVLFYTQIEVIIFVLKSAEVKKHFMPLWKRDAQMEGLRSSAVISDVNLPFQI
jgi:hypothetical protein